VTDVVKEPGRRKRAAVKRKRRTSAPAPPPLLVQPPPVPAVVVVPVPVPMPPAKRVATPRQVIYAQIDAERGRQDAQWGGAYHDNGHSRRIWSGLIGEHVDRATKLARSRSASSGDSYRHRLVVIAALCIAAIEAHDRKEQLK
jgi:hypothetical protein